MPDIIDTNGLQTKTLNEIISDLETGLKGIYGSDINVESNSPDGQLINILAQAMIDMRELLTSTYNSFNPDRASGRVLDERVLINNIERKGGTFTTVAIDVTVDRTVELQGLDADYNNPDGTGYAIYDDAGTEFILVDTATFNAGTTSANFRAKNIGKVETTVGTIVNQSTILLGVISVNNPSGALQTGENEETDAQLRTRRTYSVSNISEGYLDGLRGAILSLDGVTEAKVFENFTATADAFGIPANSVWIIVEGGANSDIADVIYAKKSYGCGMLGSVTVDITTLSGETFTASFDRPQAKNLFIQFDAQPTNSTATIDLSALKSYIVENLSYSIGEFAETSRITQIARDGIIAQSSDFVAINMEISVDDSTYVDFLEVDTLDEQWTVDATRITITEL